MKKNLLLLCLFLLVTRYASSQNGSIVSIDAVVTQMNKSLETYRKEEKISSPEGSRHVHYMDHEVKLVVVQEQGKIEKHVAWYYAGQMLIYTETNWINSATGERLYQEKTYHDKSGLIAWLNSESTFVDTSSQEFKTLDRQLSAYGLKIMKEALESEE